mmetsp:Transcript_19397/g.31933  ORF Transcript_19397/g.31933 Transcript_19397/m.31933 type:complete len:348 (+) Transcript_19397:396-1439(+)|eukprot:CAMPEP_0203745114 /NCGR_PEP_ID=MMETSP0098-20131031/955_1 /ASSEMBLY_ACC=CAM_ASM_000208 /TAXON_ID=96639 /ORGANISM=" , Strain NY0313808BC1" /LENGTH=347 /DNA_ID=CAMNT_0050632809 /DNA_START=196 /DNA_END=1239 /DNA_ORIENTATION=+
MKVQAVCLPALVYFTSAANLRNNLQDDGWSYAGTTIFGSGDSTWPAGGTDSLSLNKINAGPEVYGGKLETGYGLNETGKGAIKGGRMGAALPWVDIFSIFGGRDQYLKAVIDGTTSGGRDTCFLVQPMKTGVYPDDYEVEDVDIESLVAAQGSDGNYYVYLVVPYEGCGGNGWNAADPSAAQDVFNDCVAKVQYADYVGFLNGVSSAWDNVCTGANGKPISDKCSAICSTYSEGEWSTPSEEVFIEAGSCPEGISSYSEWGKSPTTALEHFLSDGTLSTSSTCASYVNWCSGKSMHFDIAMDTPLWANDYDSSTVASLGSPSESMQNIMVRYRPVPCNIWGPFDSSA